MDSRSRSFVLLFAEILLAVFLVAGLADAQSNEPNARARDIRQSAPTGDYVVGPQDILMITSYDQSDLSGKFAVETDGTFTYPLIGRVKAGGLTLREVEAQLKKQLVQDGFFRNPQITVAVEQYRSQKIFVVGEVRTPGSYPLSGEMNLVEALARAGSTLPTASGEAVIVHAGDSASGPTLPTQDDAKDIVRINLRDLEKGVFSQNTVLRDGDTIFVPRAESIYVFGQVKNPGAYPLQQKDTSVLQALSLAGGVNERGSTSRIRIVRIVKGEKKELGVKLADVVQPGDTIVVPERFF
jgi:polysaccharide export outer membrane protein